MDQGQLSQYRSAILSGTPSAPSAPSPLATPDLASTFAHLSGIGASNMGGMVSKQQTNAFGGAASAVANQNEADLKQKLQDAQDQADAIAQQKQDMLDPTKYRQEISPDGGYQFFDPSGKQIDVKQYSAITGKHVTDILKKSQNPYDQQFVGDYNLVEKLGKVMQSGDKKALDKLYKDNPGLQKDVGNKTYAQIVTDFRKAYPRFFNQTQAPDTGANINKQKPSQIGGGGNQNIVQKFLGALFGG